MNEYEEWKLLRKFVIIVFLAVVLGMSFNDTAYSSTVDWEQKYRDQKAKSWSQYQRIKVLNQRNRTLRIVIRRRSTLAQRVVPWVRLATCESGRRWHYNGSSGFDGGLQFSPRTWRAFGGRTFSEYAWQATPIQQVAIAQKVLARQGRMAWPGCTRKGAW